MYMFQLFSGGIKTESADVPLPNSSLKPGGTARGRLSRDLLGGGLSTWDPSLEIQHQHGLFLLGDSPAFLIRSGALNLS